MLTKLGAALVAVVAVTSCTQSPPGGRDNIAAARHRASVYSWADDLLPKLEAVFAATDRLEVAGNAQADLLIACGDLHDAAIEVFEMPDGPDIAINSELDEAAIEMADAASECSDAVDAVDNERLKSISRRIEMANHRLLVVSDEVTRPYADRLN